MSSDFTFSKEKLDECLKELGIEKLEFLDSIINSDYEQIYTSLRKSESENKEILLEIQDDYPGLINKDNISDVIAKVKQKKLL